MNDYQHLIDELTWFAAQDKDFIALHESINTKAAEAIKTLIAERDAAFAMSKCECESNEACKNLVALHDEVERLKSALREARVSLIDIDEFTVEPVCNIAKEAIAKIDEVLK